MSRGQPSWEPLPNGGPGSVEVQGVRLSAGSPVRLSPRGNGGDIFERVLDGRTAVVEEVLEDYEGRLQLAVTVTDDPGRDLGMIGRPGHRFFFGVDEVAPLAPGDGAAPPPAARVLVAGIGNVFLGDDGWGVALASRLAERSLPQGVEVADFGIRGMDLAYALLEGYTAAILLDAVPRGQPPGSLYVIEAETDDDGPPALDAHGMDPVKVLALARSVGGRLPRTLIVGCEPARLVSPEEEDIVAELSEPVRASLERATALVEELLEDLTNPDAMEDSEDA